MVIFHSYVSLPEGSDIVVISNLNDDSDDCSLFQQVQHEKYLQYPNEKGLSCTKCCKRNPG